MLCTPYFHASHNSGVSFFHLLSKKSRNQFARQVGRPKVGPTVFVDLTTKEMTAVRALLANYFRASYKVWVIAYQGAAFSGNDVLGLLK